MIAELSETPASHLRIYFFSLLGNFSDITNKADPGMKYFEQLENI